MSAATDVDVTTTQVYRVYIKATPQAIWDAITQPEWTERYGYGGRGEYELRPGGTYIAYTSAAMREQGAPDVAIRGEVLEADPPRKLVHTQLSHFSPEAEAEGYSRVTWEIEPVGDSCRVTVVHDQMREGACEQLYGGWPMILSGLKTWLETGELLTTPGSLMYT